MSKHFSTNSPNNNPTLASVLIGGHNKKGRVVFCSKFVIDGAGIYRGWNTDKKIGGLIRLSVSFMFFTTQGLLKSTSMDNFITDDLII